MITYYPPATDAQKHTSTHKQQLEERPWKLEETHLTSVQGRSLQTQTSRGGLGSQKEEDEEEEIDRCQALGGCQDQQRDQEKKHE